MLKVTLRGLLAHKLRLSLTAVAIVLGIAFVSSTFVVGDTINNVFGNIFTDANHGISVVVEGQSLAGAGQDIGGGERRPVPASLVAPVQKVNGVSQAYGIIFRTGATLLSSTGTPIGGHGAPTFGANWANTPGSPFHFRSGHPPQAADEVGVDAATAAANGIHLGQRIDMVFNGGPKQSFRVSGIVGYGQADNVAGATIALFTTSTAMRVLDTQGNFDQITVYSAGGVSDATLRDRIAKILPTDMVAQTGTAQAAQQVQATQSVIGILSTALLVFGLIALFVGSFLIVNTFTILIAQRSRELALLRALGATRRQVMISVLTEAFLTGLVASAIGAGLGILLAIGLARLLGFSLTNGGLTITPRSFIVSIVVGIAVTVVAAVLPARRATRVAPMAALRDAVPEAAPVTRRRIVGGAIVAVIGASLLGTGLFADTGQTLLLLGLGALALFIGIAYLSPLLVRPVAGVIGRPLARLRGVPGRLARENAIRSPRRTASTAAALMIGVALIAAVAVIASSFKASGEASIVGSLNSQLLVTDTASRGGFTTDVVTVLTRDPRLVNLTEVRANSVVIGSANQSLLAIDVAAINHTVAFDMVSGDATSIADPTNMLVDDGTATTRGWVTGSTVRAQFPYSSAAVTKHIGGVYHGNALISGFVVSLATYSANFPKPQQDIAILANPSPGQTLSSADAALKSDLAAFPTLTVQTKQEFIDANSKSIDQAQSLIDVLLILSVIIAALGVVNTLALSVLERSRELGLLRALGLTRRQTRSMVRWEAVIIALLGAVLGLVIGAGMGTAVVRALANQGLSKLSVPAMQLLEYVVAAFVIGVLAAVLPARRAARLNVLDAIAME
ncbi:MAG: FtsX-like permease family protein [Candidatus Dormibacteraeota bacterium]|nr:FtsX-like permease family protein [Candidatus Dormibacteraeota bacterium]